MVLGGADKWCKNGARMVQQKKKESSKPEKRMVQKVVQWCSYENKENALTEATNSVRA
jgi:hypothetical protein